MQAANSRRANGLGYFMAGNWRDGGQSLGFDRAIVGVDARQAIGKFLEGRKLYSLYRVPWQDMDLSDPHHPKLRAAK